VTAAEVESGLEQYEAVFASLQAVVGRRRRRRRRPSSAVRRPDASPSEADPAADPARPVEAAAGDGPDDEPDNLL
jgi:hypothetical protein